MLMVWWKKSTSKSFPKNKQVESFWFVYFLWKILTQSLQNALNFAKKMKEMQMGRWVCQEANTLHNSRHRLHQNFDKNKKIPKCAKVQFLWAAQTRYWYIMALQRGSSHDLMATISEIESSILPRHQIVFHRPASRHQNCILMLLVAERTANNTYEKGDFLPDIEMIGVWGGGQMMVAPRIDVRKKVG